MEALAKIQNTIENIPAGNISSICFKVISHKNTLNPCPQCPLLGPVNYDLSTTYLNSFVRKTSTLSDLN